MHQSAVTQKKRAAERKKNNMPKGKGYGYATTKKKKKKKKVRVIKRK